MSDPQVTVLKLNLAGEVVWRYSGQLLARFETEVVLEAPFNRDRMDLGYVTLKTGDRFVEHFYSDRWYNVFAIFDVEDGAHKGWYCNITRPAEFAQTAAGLEIRSVDLALDYFVQPSGRDFVLDEAEFESLELAPAEAQAGRAALAELQALAARREGPFGVNTNKPLARNGPGVRLD
jgi:uncharacterized protein